MNRLLLLLSLPVLLFASCNKKNDTWTKVGFYFEEETAQGDLYYDLYIDNKFEGKIGVYPAEPNDANLLLFRTLDGSKHDIDVKQGNNLLTASYLQISKKKTCSGTNREKAFKVTGKNGAKYREVKEKGYSVFALFK